MKTFKIILSALAVLLLGALVYIEARPLFTQENPPPTEETVLTTDSSSISSACTPFVFTDFHDVTTYQTNRIEQFVEDSIFRYMDINIIQDISYMLIRSNGMATIKDIIQEYLEHKNIYDSRTYRLQSDSPEASQTVQQRYPDTIPRISTTSENSDPITNPKTPQS